MKPIESINRVDIYEMNGTDVFGIDQPKVTVRNHWNRQAFVVIETPSGEIFTVNATALEKAIRNAQNAHE